MNLYQFLFATGNQKPLIAIQGNIFETPADHIAFAMHYKKDSRVNHLIGFAGKVAKYGWPELKDIDFEKGVPVTQKIKGKHFHACPIHTNEEGGWDEAPELIEQCFNKLPVSGDEVVASVLMGGGLAGMKYKATVNNLQGMVRTYKTVVLYVYEKNIFDLLVGVGAIAATIPTHGKLSNLPKIYRIGERNIAETIDILSLT